MPHIIERGEQLDYERFYQHGKSLKEWGPMTWEIYEGLADAFPCGTCRPGAQALTHGGHDAINLFLGKKVQTPRHLERLIDMVHQAEKLYAKAPMHSHRRHVAVG